jgi:hypothetical protein
MTARIDRHNLALAGIYDPRIDPGRLTSAIAIDTPQATLENLAYRDLGSVLKPA